MLDSLAAGAASSAALDVGIVRVFSRHAGTSVGALMATREHVLLFLFQMLRSWLVLAQPPPHRDLSL